MDRVEKTEQEPVSLSRARASIGALEDHLPFDWNADHASLRELATTLATGFTEKDLDERAASYTARVSQTGEPILPLATWLHQQRTGNKSCLTLASS